jgi:hypothetical protein
MTESELYEIPYGKNTYCGPAALAYLMRSDPDTAARLLRKVSGKKAIIGVGYKHMHAALADAGLHYAAVMPTDRKLTLTHWLKTIQPEQGQEFLLGVNTDRGPHYIVIRGDRYFDSMCHLGKPVAKCPYLNRGVKAAWRVEKEPFAIAWTEQVEYDTRLEALSPMKTKKPASVPEPSEEFVPPSPERLAYMRALFDKGKAAAAKRKADTLAMLKQRRADAKSKKRVLP